MGILRRYTFKLYPNAAQAAELDRQRRMHCALYNALLQQRIEAYQRCVDHETGKGKTLSFYDQGKELTALRADDPEYRALAQAAMECTAKKLDDAFKAFFSRAKKGAGASSGFPRFKRSDDYPGFSFRRHGSGWKLELNATAPKGKLYIKGCPGMIKLRGTLPCAAEFKTCDLLWRAGVWRLSLVVEMEPRRVAPMAAGHIHLNLVTSFASIRKQDGGCPAGPEASISVAADGRISLQYQQHDSTSAVGVAEIGADDRLPLRKFEAAAAVDAAEMEADDRNGGWDVRRGGAVGVAEIEADDKLEAEPAAVAVDAVGLGSDDRQAARLAPRVAKADITEKITSTQQAMARCTRGSYRYRQLRRHKQRLEQKRAWCRANVLHNFSAAIACEFGGLTILAPDKIKDLTASAAGTARDPGAAVAWKCGFNRHVLDMAPARLVSLITEKVTEGGGTVLRQTDHEPVAALGNDIARIARAAKRINRLKGQSI